MAYINGKKVLTIVKSNGGGGTNVVANPSGTPTNTLETVQIDNTIYAVGKKCYNFVLQDNDGTNSLSLQINIPYERMQDVYDGINQALGGNISTPQEVIAVYDSLKADNISQQAFAMLLTLFGSLAQVCLFSNLNNIYVDGDGGYKITGIAALAGPLCMGNTPIFSDTLASNKISFTSNSTLTINERNGDELD